MASLLLRYFVTIYLKSVFLGTNVGLFSTNNMAQSLIDFGNINTIRPVLITNPRVKIEYQTIEGQVGIQFLVKIKLIKVNVLNMIKGSRSPNLF